MSNDYQRHCSHPYELSNAEAFGMGGSAMFAAISHSRPLQNMASAWNLLLREFLIQREEKEAVRRNQKEYGLSPEQTRELLTKLRDFNTFGLGEIRFADRDGSGKALNGSSAWPGVIRMSLAWIGEVASPDGKIGLADYLSCLYHEVSHKIGFYYGVRGGETPFVRWTNEVFADGNSALILGLSSDDAYRARIIRGKDMAEKGLGGMHDSAGHPGDLRRAAYAKRFVEDGYLTSDLIRQIARDTKCEDQGLIEAVCDYYQEIRPRVMYIDDEIRCGSGKDIDPLAYAKNPTYMDVIDELCGLTKDIKARGEDRRKAFLRESYQDFRFLPWIKDLISHFSDRLIGTHVGKRDAKRYFLGVRTTEKRTIDPDRFRRSVKTVSTDQAPEETKAPVRFDNQVSFDKSLAYYRQKASEHNAALNSGLSKNAKRISL